MGQTSVMIHIHSRCIGEKQGSTRCDAWIWILLDEIHSTNYEIFQFHRSWLLTDA